MQENPNLYGGGTRAIFEDCLKQICNEFGRLSPPSQALMVTELASRFVSVDRGCLVTLSEHLISHRPTLGELLINVLKSDAFDSLETYPSGSGTQRWVLSLTVSADVK
jgi:hypothetical protein